MEIQQEVICVVNGYRLMEHRVIYKEKVIDTYYNIMDERGDVFGKDFREIEWPLNLLLSIDLKMTSYFKLDDHF